MSQNAMRGTRHEFKKARVRSDGLPCVQDYALREDPKHWRGYYLPSQADRYAIL